MTSIVACVRRPFMFAERHDPEFSPQDCEKTPRVIVFGLLFLIILNEEVRRGDVCS